MKKLEQILEQYEQDTFTDGIAVGLDDAVIGVCKDFNSVPRLVYSVKKCIEILMKDTEVSEDELEEGETIESKKRELASEYFGFNVSGAYVGEKTPVWCHDEF